MTPDRCVLLALDKVALPSWDWHYDNLTIMEKLGASLARNGQLSPILVRQVADHHEVIDGRRRVQLLRLLDATHVLAIDAGPISDTMAVRLALDLETLFGIDYVRLAAQVRALADADDDPATFAGRLAATAPWNAERIGYFVQLAAPFDWSVFEAVPDEQSVFGWDLAPDLASDIVADVPAGALDASLARDLAPDDGVQTPGLDAREALGAPQASEGALDDLIRQPGPDDASRKAPGALAPGLSRPPSRPADGLGPAIQVGLFGD